MKKKVQVTNSRELLKLQKAMTEIGIFELQFQNFKKGDVITQMVINRIQEAAASILVCIQRI